MSDPDPKSEVPSLSAITAAPDGGTIAMLEELLTRARDGSLQSFTLAGEMTGGDIITVQAGTHDVFRMVGALEELKLRVMRRPTDEDVVDMLED